MFGLEAYAKLFDKIHEENRRSLNIEFQGWINDIYRSEGENWRFYGAAATAAAADAIYAFAGGAGAGLVDLLRLGDGVASGTLKGFGQDGLRLITLVGGVFRVVRVGMATIEIGGDMSCVVSSSTKAGILSGRWFDLSALFNRLAGMVGGRAAVLSSSYPGLSTPLEFVSFFRMFTRTTVIATRSLDEVVNAAKISNGPVVFGVYWKNGGGHAMVAFRDLLGRVRFADQWGKLKTAEELLPNVQGVFGDLAILHEAAVVQVMRAGATFHVLAAQVSMLHPNGMARMEAKVREKQRPQLVR